MVCLEQASVSSLHRAVAFWLPLVHVIVLCLAFQVPNSSAVVSIPGQLLAFADLNHDRTTDVVVKTDAQKIDVYFGSESKIDFMKSDTMSISLTSDGDIFAASVGDFDGDSFADLLVSFKTDGGKKIKSQIFWGQNSGRFKPDETGPMEFAAEPTVMDCNLDGILDVFGRSDDGQSFKCLNATTRGNITASLTLAPIGKDGRFPAFVDILDWDLNPEIVVVTGDLADTKLEIWGQNSTSTAAGNGLWVKQDSMAPFDGLSPAPKIVGPPSFGDFDLDGCVDTLVPYCTAGSCGMGTIFLAVHNGTTWTSIPLNMSENWSLNAKSAETLMLRVADYTRTGYPDLLVMLHGSANDAVYVAENVACPGCDYPRTFAIDFKDKISMDLKVTMAGFFDLQEDGSLDFLVEFLTADGSYQIEPKIGKDKGDTCFLKVQVYTSTCATRCRNGKEGSGVALPGSCLKYTGVNLDGSARAGAACLLVAGTNRALGHPTVMFGLGPTPNFVETLSVGIPYAQHAQVNVWKQIIPNARLFVIPFPRSDPSAWTSRLFVMPSRLIWMSFAVLCSVCGVILILILGLHIREKRMDRRERLLEAHKFHFDAM